MSEVEAAGAVGLSGGAVDGERVSSDFDWMGQDEVTGGDRVTRLGCPCGNSCLRDVWCSEVMSTSSWRWRHARSSCEGGGGAGVR